MEPDDGLFRGFSYGVRLTDVGAVNGQAVRQPRAQAAHHPLDAPHHVHGAVHHLQHSDKMLFVSQPPSQFNVALCGRVAT